MKIKYRIIEINEKDHSFVVRYYTDLITEEMLAMAYDDNNKPIRCRSDYSLTLYDTEATPEDIDKDIQRSAPVAWFKMLEAAQQGKTVGMTNATIKLDVEHEFDHAPPSSEPKMELSDEEIEAIIARLAMPKDE